MKEFIIEKNDADTRLDKFVSKAVPSLPSNLIQKYIRLKRIKVNSSRAKPDARLALGDVVSMYLNDEFFENSRSKKAVPKLNASFPNTLFWLTSLPEFPFTMTISEAKRLLLRF